MHKSFFLLKTKMFPCSTTQENRTAFENHKGACNRDNRKRINKEKYSLTSFWNDKIFLFLEWSEEYAFSKPFRNGAVGIITVYNRTQLEGL